MTRASARRTLRSRARLCPRSRGPRAVGRRGPEDRRTQQRPEGSPVGTPLIEQLAAAPSVGTGLPAVRALARRRHRRLRVVPGTATGRSSSRRCRTASRIRVGDLARPLRLPAVLARRPLPVLHLRRPRLRVLRRLPLRRRRRDRWSTCCPTRRTSRPLPDPDLSPDGTRLAMTRLARRRLRGRRHAGAAEPAAAAASGT